MAGTPTPILTSEMARDLVSGAAPLNQMFNVSPEQIAEIALFGHDLWRQGRREEARKVFLGLIALDEGIYYGHAGMGLLAMAEGDFASAEKYLEKAAALEPSDVAVGANLGEVLLRQGKIEAAVTALQHAAELDKSGKHAGAIRARAILVALEQGSVSEPKPGADERAL
jgi:tetratricopeptide (TPR) repeat protein